MARSGLPGEPAAETLAQRDHITAERLAGERIVFENEHFMALVPWLAA
jgi:galactose-1-phosphate uridylyltransferase